VPWTLSPARRIAAALALAAGAAVLAAPPALAQPAAQVTVDPNQGAPGSQFTVTLANYHACAADSPNCIIIDFVQSGAATRIGVADSHGAPSFSGTVAVPPSAKAGAATIHAHSTTDDASADYTVTGAAATTTTGGSTTTTASTTTTVAPTTTLTTVVPPLTEPSSTTTTTVAKKKSSSSHSDVPRYIAVALVVLAAAGTAAVDTQLRRMRGPGGPAGP
jgi:hypothetical protein